MLEFVAVVEIELTQDELDKLGKLSKQLGQDLPETVRECLNRSCDDMLVLLSQKPENENISK